jgi:hypothetical protein
MSKLIKIYDGMTFDMSTGAVIEHGAVTYHAEEDIAMCGGGGGPSEQKSTTGYTSEYKPQITSMLDDAEAAYDSGKLGKVAGFTQAGREAQRQGIAAAGNQTGIANTMMGIAQAPVDLSGQRAAALQQAQGALGTSQAMAGQRGGLGGSRQAINQAGIEQSLAANFAGIDQAAQQQQVGNLNAAMGMQGQGANTLGMIGQAQQAQNQAQGDADYTALAQRIGLFSGVAPKEQTTTKTGGK